MHFKIIDMNISVLTQNKKEPQFGVYRAFEHQNEKLQSVNHAYTKQEVYERKVDEFFLTDNMAQHKRFSPLALAGSIAGVLLPTLILGKIQKPNIKINSFKNFFKVMNIKYDLGEILAVGLGGAYGGLLGGLLDKKEPEKLQKLEEGMFQTMNIIFPSALIAGAMKICEKNKYLKHPIGKITASAIAMFVGATTAVKIANKLDSKYFDKYYKDQERQFRKKDLLVHFDDLFGALVLAKLPIANKLPISSILPAIFAWSGYHVGDS